MMELPLLTNRTRLPKTFTDVVYLTNRPHMPKEIKRLLSQKKLSYAMVPYDQFPELRKKTHLIGAAIIDAEDSNAFEHQEIGHIIQSLEQDNIGVIVLTHRVQRPIKSFSLSPAKTSFSVPANVDAISPDELWIQLSVNLAFRKKSTGISARPSVPASRLELAGTNKLAEQLKMTGSLVDNLTEQLRMAGMVQRDFLPTQLPESDTTEWATTFLPAEWVSGDLYHIDQLDDDHIGFYIVDAVGHGMPAALLTVFVKQAMRLKEMRDAELVILPPSEVMARLNTKMAQEKFSGYQFATCCYCLINTKTYELTYARAGHPYPMLIRPGQPTMQLEARGSLLGVFEQAEYPEECVQLEPGDKLVIYSDGAEPFIGNFFDEKGFVFFDEFKAILDAPVVDMLDRFVTLTKTKEIDPGSFDDITLIGMEIKDLPSVESPES
ncbi:MAG: serine/threonine-protein phosphatase [Planctomycetes bacterium]|nr:serine/threonine-protein phosphatase [Planctomycetota bacterium]